MADVFREGGILNMLVWQGIRTLSSSTPIAQSPSVTYVRVARSRRPCRILRRPVCRAAGCARTRCIVIRTWTGAAAVAVAAGLVVLNGTNNKIVFWTQTTTTTHRSRWIEGGAVAGNIELLQPAYYPFLSYSCHSVYIHLLLAPAVGLTDWDASELLARVQWLLLAIWRKQERGIVVDSHISGAVATAAAAAFAGEL